MALALALRLKNSWKLPSVHGLAIVTALQGSLSADPHLLDFIPDHYRHMLLGAVSLYALIGRFLTILPHEDS